MSEQVDPEFLKKEAYDDGSELATRNQIQEDYSTRNRSWFQWVFDKLHLPEEARILELGCGAGDLWLDHLSHLSGSWEMHLSDLSLGMLRDTQERLMNKGIGFTFEVLDAQAIPFSGAQFDIAIGNGLLDHIPDQENALAEIWRVLKPGGIFYTSSGSRHHLQEMDELVAPFYPTAKFGGDPERFGLENGLKILSALFSNIQTYRFADKMVFRQADPLIDYILSEAKVKRKLEGEKLLRFKQFVEQKLILHEKIVVTIEKGLFVCWKERE